MTAAPERKAMLVYAEPTRDEIRKWANSALRNSEIDFIDADLIEDFKDGLPALRAPDLPPTLAQALKVPEVAAMMEALREMDDAFGCECGDAARQALAAIEAAMKEGE